MLPYTDAEGYKGALSSGGALSDPSTEQLLQAPALARLVLADYEHCVMMSIEYISNPTGVNLQSSNGQGKASHQLSSGVDTVSAWVAISSYGKVSEVWVERQVRGFQRLRPKVVTWLPGGPFADAASKGVDVVWLTGRTPPRVAWRRWLFRWRHRLSRLRSLLTTGNFYAAHGAERRELEWLMAQDRPAVVLAHFGDQALNLLPLTRAHGVPLVAHFHGYDLSWALRARRYRWSLLRQLHAFAAIVVVGSHQRRWMLEHGAPPERLHLIPCGVPTDQFIPNDRIADGPFRFVTASRLVPEKGVDIALKAFAILRSEGLDVALDIVGDGPERASLEAWVRTAGLGDAVTFHGAVPSDRVHAVYQEAEAFLQHSLDGATGWVEGFGVSISEASATGLPVVVSDCGGIPDQVIDGETGFLVSQGDVAGMTDAMRRLVEDRALGRRMGRAGRAHMVTHFDTCGQLRKLEDVLLRAAGNVDC